MIDLNFEILLSLQIVGQIVGPGQFVVNQTIYWWLLLLRNMYAHLCDTHTHLRVVEFLKVRLGHFSPLVAHLSFSLVMDFGLILQLELVFCSFDLLPFYSSANHGRETCMRLVKQEYDLHQCFLCFCYLALSLFNFSYCLLYLFYLFQTYMLIYHDQQSVLNCI